MPRLLFLLTALLAPLPLSSGHLEGPSLKNQLETTQDYDTIGFPPATDGNELKWAHIEGTYTSTGRNYSAWFATFHPSYFSFLPSTRKGCVSLIKTSVASNESWSNCEFATNGGFFDTNAQNLVVDGGTLCHGNLISSTSAQGAPLYSQVPTDNSGSSRANFGLTFDGLVVTGFIEAATIQNDIKFSNLLTGWGWVVRGGVSNVAKSQDFTPTSGFVTEKAPRTAVGVMPSGLMCLLEIDGQEDIKVSSPI